LAENSLVKIQTPTKDTLLLGYTPHDAAVFSTGFPVFDKLIGGGLRPGGTYFLYAPPGTGKTTLLLQIAANIIGGEK
jgi:DNA repair protein RadA/Sms